jgi:ribonucleoside-diphosphate reductase beta chain
MNSHLKYILIEALSEVAGRIHGDPGNMAHLVEGITLYHVIIEGTMALAGQRGILEFYRMNNLFPAFRGGFTAVARDESRHVVFGVKFLREMIQRDASNARIVHDAVEKYAPTALEGISPTQEQIQNMLANGDDPWTTPRYALESLAKKLKVIGLSMKLPQIQGMPL